MATENEQNPLPYEKNGWKSQLIHLNVAGAAMVPLGNRVHWEEHTAAATTVHQFGLHANEDQAGS